MSVDSSSAGSSKARFLDLNALRGAQIAGSSFPKDKSTESSQESGEAKPSFQKVLNSLINDQLAAQKEKEVLIADEKSSQKPKPVVGLNDGFNRGGGQISDWGPGRNA